MTGVPPLFFKNFINGLFPYLHVQGKMFSGYRPRRCHRLTLHQTSPDLRSTGGDGRRKGTPDVPVNTPLPTSPSSSFRNTHDYRTDRTCVYQRKLGTSFGDSVNSNKHIMSHSLDSKFLKCSKGRPVSRSSIRETFRWDWANGGFWDGQLVSPSSYSSMTHYLCLVCVLVVCRSYTTYLLIYSLVLIKFFS